MYLPEFRGQTIPNGSLTDTNTPLSSVAPPGWVMVTGATDRSSSTTRAFAANFYARSASPDGGTYYGFNTQEEMSTTITGLIAGRDYRISYYYLLESFPGGTNPPFPFNLTFRKNPNDIINFLHIAEDITQSLEKCMGR